MSSDDAAKKSAAVTVTMHSLNAPSQTSRRSSFNDVASILLPHAQDMMGANGQPIRAGSLRIPHGQRVFLLSVIPCLSPHLCIPPMNAVHSLPVPRRASSASRRSSTIGTGGGTIGHLNGGQIIMIKKSWRHIHNKVCSTQWPLIDVPALPGFIKRVFTVVANKHSGVQRAFAESAVLVAIDQGDPSAAVEMASGRDKVAVISVC